MDYLLVRGFLRPGLALLAVTTLALGPIYASITPAFMTDVPTFAFQSLALVLAARAMRERRLSRPWLAAALLAAFAGFTMREYPWRTSSFPGPDVELRLLPDFADVRLAGRTAYTLALLVSPETIYVLFRGRWQLLVRHRWVTVVSAVLFLGGTQLLGGVLLGSYVGMQGSYTCTVRECGPVVVTPWVWTLFVAVCVSAP